jgi:hypothetical protein
MARILMASAAMLLWLAGSDALAQSGSTSPDPGAETAPLELPGPIVNGKHLQPTLSDIIERQALKQPGQLELPPPPQGGGTSDKELDELYDQVLKQSQPRE